MVFLIVVIAYLAMFVLAFIVGEKEKNHGLIDVFWGLGFIVGALASYLYGPKENMVALMINILVTLWGLRLAYYLFKRNYGKPEDERYLIRRERWRDNFAFKMFTRMYLFQLVMNLIINIPVILANQKLASSFTLLTYLGIGLWLVGYFFQVLGDSQLKKFKANPKNKGKIMDQGLWSLTRHPNYFGEVTMWWGIFLMALSIKVSIFAIISPILVTFLLLRVSGVKMMEGIMEGRPGWDEYAAKTNKFFPWF